MKHISILGSTGSIGVTTLKVVENLNDKIKIKYLSAFSNADLLIEQMKKFKPKSVAIVDPKAYEKVKSFFISDSIEILKGRDGLLSLASRDDIDLMLNGLVGASGMEPTLNAIKAGVNVALSNKESLVMAGEIINLEMEKTGAKLFPVDSEHSAIWQCMLGENIEDIENLVITASGGPFRERPIKSFKDITKKEALNHPNWEMGEKITIDSATMMNKGFEVIEAFWLFGFSPSNIKVVVHPQSIIHSMIEFKDGAIKAQLGVPDMKVPIQYALTYPRHLKAPWDRLDFFSCGKLTFREPDLEKFPCISLAFKSLEKLGTMPAALNLANDYAVLRFLKNQIGFLDIHKINKIVMETHDWIEHPNLDDLRELDIWVRKVVFNF